MSELFDITDENIVDPAYIQRAAEGLSSNSRRERQEASSFLFQVSLKNPSALPEFGDQILDALNCKEARTRWECLDALTNLVAVDSRLCDKAIGDAEASLFDEGNGSVRLAAFRFLCKLGATTENRSEKVWPLLDEAVQCFHGDNEFNDMLVALADFAAGKASADVRSRIVERMTFDAENSKGSLKRKAQAVIDSANRK